MDRELQQFRQAQNRRDVNDPSTVTPEDALSINSVDSSVVSPENVKGGISDRSAHRIRLAANDSGDSSEPDAGNGLAREKTHEIVYEPINPYTYAGAQGWRKYRLLRPFRGIYHDIKRRLPYYASDFTDALTYRAVASTIRIYFVNLLPALAYTLDMYRRTGHFYGINEGLLSSALAAGIFGLFSAQPITIVGVTGLISLFNYTIYKIITPYDDTIYPQFMAWTGIWTAVFHWLVAITNLCDYMRYVTDFSSETFGMYVGIIYLIKGVEELVAEFDQNPTSGFMGIVVAILYFGSVYTLEKFGSGLFFNPAVRGFVADYAYPIATIFWVGFCHIPGTLKDTHTQLLPITQAYRPSTDRDWVVDFWNLEVKWVFAAMPFGLLVTNVSSLTAQAKQYPLKKPGGFHWDFFLLGCTSFVSGVIGIPLPNGLVPQAPVHTDSLCVYQTDLQVIRTEDVEGEEIRRPKVRILNVVEQRVTHITMALLLFGTMTRPLLVVLGTMPRTIFAGVFLTVGWGSIEGNGITHKLVHLITESRFRPPDDPLYKVPSKKITLYIILQLLSVVICVAISQTVAAVGFPLLICALIPLRWVYFKRWFAEMELSAMDSLTADSAVVLASLGGRPEGSGGMATGINKSPTGIATMGYKVFFLMAIGLPGLGNARYLPPQQAHSTSYDGQKSLFKRQMENPAYNPFAPLTNPQNAPNLNPQNAAPNTNINLADQVEEVVVQNGEGTPTFQALRPATDPEDIPVLGMAGALGRLDLSRLVNGPNVIRPVMNLVDEVQTEREIVGDQIQAPIDLSQQIRTDEGIEQDVQITEQLPLQNPGQTLEASNVQIPQEGQLQEQATVQVNNGEEYEYAPFILDPTEPDWDQFPGLTRNPGDAGRMLASSRQLNPLPRRPPDLPKYSPCGRRMGFILNRGIWLDGPGDGPGLGYADVPPFWGIIEPGDEVAEEPQYRDDNWELNWTEEEIRECEQALWREAAGIIDIPEELDNQDDDEIFQDAFEPTAEEQARINAELAEIEYRRLIDEANRDPGVIQGDEREDTDISDEVNVSAGSERYLDDVVAELQRPIINLNANLDPNYIPPRPGVNLAVAEEEEEQKFDPNNLNARQGRSRQQQQQPSNPNSLPRPVGRPRRNRIGNVTTFLRNLPGRAQSGIKSTVSRIRRQRQPHTTVSNEVVISPDWNDPGNVAGITTDIYNAPLLNFGDSQPLSDEDFNRNLYN
ncbi:hypothetical protein Dda_5713 [Drechslerella dactyloides]|uniref:Bicarbonate transporter-like transmembrane domain-containing protein n=1 Tax=Drechslerella dactyloides TaxID=74499 RepID=A0AAD6J105_DREDA|nr:hypothetical protein Dda_5713 [Drechslerella dactyloides]